METFGGLHRRLTKLYTDTKHSCDVVTNQENVANIPELFALHLKFRIQRERLSAWGLRWSDDNVATEVFIDDSVAKAGQTEAVADVLKNIQNVLEEAEKFGCERSPAPHFLATEKARLHLDNEDARWSIEDRARYEQLAKDLKDAIDLLYELCNTRRELRQGTYPPATKSSSERHAASIQSPLPLKALAAVAAATATKTTTTTTTSFGQSTGTLINPHTVRSSALQSELSSTTANSLELPHRLDPDLLDISEERPPPYDHIGATLSSRIIAYLKQPSFPSSMPTSNQSLIRIPVLVEFAVYDPAYRVTGVAVPTKRLDSLLALYARSSSAYDQSTGGHLSCLGYFEDTNHPRFGLVYELPKFPSTPSSTITLSEQFQPTSLLKLMQASSRTSNTAARVLPPGPYLEDRFRLAFNLLYSFFKMHAEDGFLHKNVKSENILFFRTDDEANHEDKQNYDIRTPFISSFDLFTEFNLEKVQSPSVKHLYRHEADPVVSNLACPTCLPQSQLCTCPQYRFDIYGLGMILFEIGLWMPLFDLYKSKYSLTDFHRRIDSIWLRRLRTKCGSLYTSVVQDILHKASAQIDEDSLTQLYTVWLTKLSNCCLIDESDDPWPPSLLSSKYQPLWPAKHVYHSQVSQSTQLPSPIAKNSGITSIQVKETTPTPPSGLSTAVTNSREELPARQVYGIVSASTHCEDTVTEKTWKRAQSADSDVGQTTSEHTKPEFPLIPPMGSPNDPDPFQPVTKSQPKSKLRIHSIHLKKELTDLWHTQYQPRLERIVNHALRHSPESASIELHMIGERANSAIPTILVTCTSSAKVRAALNKKWHHDPNEIQVKVLRGKIRRSKAVAPKSCPPHRSMANDGDPMSLNKFHQQRPVCGASIGAYVGERHLPPVSFGGIIDIDGEAFGMTVHHLLDSPSEDENDSEVDEEEITSGATRSSHHTQRLSPMADLIGGIGGNQSLSHYHSVQNIPFEISDEEEDDFSDEEVNDGDDAGYSSDESLSTGTDHSGTQGDIDGIVAGARVDVLVTQPALDDIDDDFFPCPEDRDEDHLDSHTLGHIHASSGIKRWHRNGILHEIDWALLKINENRLQPYNLIQGGGRYYRNPVLSGIENLAGQLREPVYRGGYASGEDEIPTTIAPSDQLSNLWVHCFGRTSGLQCGRIGPTMSSVRIYNRCSFSRSWYIVGNFGVGGDSGAWVIDNEHGRVCGHVLAWCSRNSIAYICPADVLLDDMKRTLGATRICLPGSPGQAWSLLQAVPQAVVQNQSPDELLDIQRLDIRDDDGTNGHDLMRSRLNASAVSPRMELFGLYGGQIAR